MEVVTVVNRTDKAIEFVFDSRPFIVPANGQLNTQDDAGWHGYYQCIAKLDPITNMALHLLGIKNIAGDVLADCSPLNYHKAPYEELLDRVNMEGKFETKVFSNPDAAKTRVDAVQISTPQSLRAPDLVDKGDV